MKDEGAEWSKTDPYNEEAKHNATKHPIAPGSAAERGRRSEQVFKPALPGSTVYQRSAPRPAAFLRRTQAENNMQCVLNK